VPVSTTIKPVTQMALVEVKKAFVKCIPECVALGSISKNVPTRMARKKLPANMTAGLVYL